MIRITYDNKNSSSHGDLSIVFDELELVEIVDSYYLSIDQYFLPDNIDDDRIGLILKRLIEWWSSQVLKLSDNEMTYLPWDFSDQYLGCFRVKQINKNLLSIGYGFTTSVTGYSITPSRLINSNIIDLIDEKFEIASKTIELDKQLLLSHIKKISI